VCVLANMCMSIKNVFLSMYQQELVGRNWCYFSIRLFACVLVNMYINTHIHMIHINLHNTCINIYTYIHIHVYYFSTSLACLYSHFFQRECLQTHSIVCVCLCVCV